MTGGPEGAFAYQEEKGREHLSFEDKVMEHLIDEDAMPKIMQGLSAKDLALIDGIADYHSERACEEVSKMVAEGTYDATYIAAFYRARHMGRDTSESPTIH